MKCEKCGKEANFHYQANINGEKSEYHLCTDCARAAGFGNVLEPRPRSAFESFWSSPFERMVNSFWGRPFGSLMVPTLTMPRISILVGDPETSTNASEEKTDNIPEDAGPEVKAKCELVSLKSQLQEAIQKEEFEKAAELRDKIRELEK